MNPVILLVEDNATDEKLTLKAFARCDIPHEIVVVRDGVEALDYLTGSGNFAEPNAPLIPTLVLLDLKLPKLTGLEVLGAIRLGERCQLVPVVVLTASREEEDVMECRRLGANAYVRKPVDFLQFVDSANVIGQFWLRLNEPQPRQA